MSTYETRDEGPLSPGVHAVTRAGVALQYRVAGRGPLLVFHPPGWGVGPALYEATLQALEPSFTVVYVSPRGAAGMPAPPPEAALDVPAFVNDLERLRVHWGVPRVALAGHSHSGFIALHYALQYPEHVARLVLLSPQLTGLDVAPDAAPAATTPEPPEIAAALAYLGSVGGFGAIFAEPTDAGVTAFVRRIAPIYFRDPGKMAPLSAALARLTLPRRTVHEVTRSDERHALHAEALRALAIPVVIAAGRHDRVCPIERAQLLARLIPRARLRVFEASGHFPWIEEPAAFFEDVPALLHDAAATDQ